MKQSLWIGVSAALVAATFFFVYPGNSTAPSQTAPETTSSSKATLKIADAVYPITAVPGETVADAMSELSAAGKITFTTREYPGLGSLINSINGRENGDGMYWMLYKNGTTTARGARETLIVNGDVIEWRYEK